MECNRFDLRMVGSFGGPWSVISWDTTSRWIFKKRDIPINFYAFYIRSLQMFAPIFTWWHKMTPWNWRLFWCWFSMFSWWKWCITLCWMLTFYLQMDALNLNFHHIIYYEFRKGANVVTAPKIFRMLIRIVLQFCGMSKSGLPGFVRGIYKLIHRPRSAYHHL